MPIATASSHSNRLAYYLHYFYSPFVNPCTRSILAKLTSHQLTTCPTITRSSLISTRRSSFFYSAGPISYKNATPDPASSKILMSPNRASVGRRLRNYRDPRLRDQCQKLIATEHAHPVAIGTIDETGTSKSGNHTCGVKRQYNCNRGKIENCVNNVAIAYSKPGFSCLVDAQLYLPKEWAENTALRKKILFQTK